MILSSRSRPAHSPHEEMPEPLGQPLCPVGLEIPPGGQALVGKGMHPFFFAHNEWSFKKGLPHFDLGAIPAVGGHPKLVLG